jgi:hypothetical protein
MSIISAIKNTFNLKPSTEYFYSNSEIVKIEWWLSWCHEYPNLYWARLRIFSNGRADVLFQDENKTYGFESAEFAGNYISEDEFTKVQNIDADDRRDLEIPDDVLIETPNWSAKEVVDFEYIGTY